MSTRRDLLKGLLGCTVALMCAEIPVQPVAMPGVFKFRQKGASLLFGEWMSKKKEEAVWEMLKDGHQEPFVQVYDLTTGQMHLEQGTED